MSPTRVGEVNELEPRSEFFRSTNLRLQSSLVHRGRNTYDYSPASSGVRLLRRPGSGNSYRDVFQTRHRRQHCFRVAVYAICHRIFLVVCRGIPLVGCDSFSNLARFAGSAKLLVDFCLPKRIVVHLEPFPNQRTGLPVTGPVSFCSKGWMQSALLQTENRRWNHETKSCSQSRYSRWGHLV